MIESKVWTRKTKTKQNYQIQFGVQNVPGDYLLNYIGENQHRFTS